MTLPIRSDRTWKIVWVISRQYEKINQEIILAVLDHRISEDKIKFLMKAFHLTECETDDQNRLVKMYKGNRRVVVRDKYIANVGNILYTGAEQIYKAKICANLRLLNIKTGELKNSYFFDRIDE